MRAPPPSPPPDAGLELVCRLADCVGNEDDAGKEKAAEAEEPVGEPSELRWPLLAEGLERGRDGRDPGAEDGSAGPEGDAGPAGSEEGEGEWEAAEEEKPTGEGRYCCALLTESRDGVLAALALAVVSLAAAACGWMEERSGGGGSSGLYALCRLANIGWRDRSPLIATRQHTGRRSCADRSEARSQQADTRQQLERRLVPALRWTAHKRVSWQEECCHHSSTNHRVGGVTRRPGVAGTNSCSTT